MKHPAYHLRPNKMAERLVFIEAIRRLERLSSDSLADYTYYGLGGPYLEDFRLLYEFCPEIGMVSIESDRETHKRQDFHLPCSKVQLIYSDFSSFIANFNPDNTKSVFWLDYTDLEYTCFDEFKALLGLVVEESMVKVTLRCEPRDYGAVGSCGERRRKADEFRAKFGNVMPIQSADPPRKIQDFANFLQGMIQVAVAQALPPSATTLTFIPVSSFCYSDGTGMFTLTGVVCESSRRNSVQHAFANWYFANLAWNPPELIDVPVLSTRERLHLQNLLPSNTAKGPDLLSALGYLIDDDVPKTEAALEQYAAFHRYSPYVLRGVP